MNYLANKPLKFIADRYEEWSGGRCLASGPIDAVIDITVSGDVLLANINGAESLRMYSRGVYLKADESGDLGDRIQYVSPNIDMDPLNPIILHVFHQNRTISYIRFAMTDPDRIIEFYGRTVAFNGMDRPETLRFKSLFLDDLSSLYRSLLKENTVNMAVMHHQMACVAFSIKKYYTLLGTPTLGASGAIFGIQIGYAMLYPNALWTLVFPPITLKAKWFVLIFMAIELFTGITGTMDGIAHFAHLGGALFGFLLILWWKKRGTLWQR